MHDVQRCSRPLGGADWIVIKRQLTHGERDDLMGALLPGLTPGEPLHVDAKEIRTAKVCAYLVAWSSPEPIDHDTIRALDPDSFDEIDHAIDAHVEHETAARKNGQGAPSAYGPSSVSVAP